MEALTLKDALFWAFAASTVGFALMVAFHQSLIHSALGLMGTLLSVGCLYGLLDAVVDPDWCARELTWICDHWDRVEEANALRFNYGRPGGEQLMLF